MKTTPVPDVDAFAPGAVFESRSRTVTETDVVNFAGLSGDFVELHVSEERAIASRYGRRIAHGALVFSISTGLSAQLNVVNDIVAALVGVDHLRFPEPVFIGDTLRVTKRVLERRALAEGRELLFFDTRVLNQRGHAVLAYIDKLLVDRGAPQRAVEAATVRETESESVLAGR